jgi:hypothetical protein
MSIYLQPRSPIGNLRKLEFPYTPQVEYGVDVKYDASSLTHTNYQPYAYTRTENPTLGLTCKFSAHTTDHFNQSAFAIRFLQTYTKMNYGRTDPDRGQPPRIMRFYAYGGQMFHDVPVVISKFNMTFPEDIDYVNGTVDFSGQTKGPINRDQNNSSLDKGEEIANQNQINNTVWLPILFTIHITLLVQQNLSLTVNEFNLNDFAAGNLASKGYI